MFDKGARVDYIFDIQRSEKMIFDIVWSEKQILKELLQEKGKSEQEAESKSIQMIMHVTFSALTKAINRE